MPSSGVHRGLQQPVGPDPGSWRRLRGRARSRWRCWLPGRPARASASSIITQAASHGKSGQRRPSPRHRQPAQELRGGLFPLLRNLTIKIYNRQGRTQRGCTCTPPPGTISNDASHPFQAWKGGYENPENPNKIQAKFSPDPDPKDKSKTEP